MEKYKYLLLIVMLNSISASHILAQSMPTAKPVIRSQFNKTLDSIQAKHIAGYETDIANLTEKINREPGVAIHYFKRAELSAMLKKYDEAVADYRQTIFLNPSYLDAYIALANTQFKTNVDTSNIIKEFKPALKINLNNKVDYYHRASMESNLFYKKEAIVDLKRILNATPAENTRADGTRATEPTVSIFSYKLLIYNLKSIGKDSEALQYISEFHTHFPNEKL